MRPTYSHRPIPIDINLLPRRESARSVPAAGIWLMAGAIAMSAAFGWLWHDAREQLDDKRQRAAELSAKLASLQAELQSDPYSGTADGLLRLPAELRRAKPTATELFVKLNKLMPRYANVTQLEWNDNNEIDVSANFATAEDWITFSMAVRQSVSFKLIGMGPINNAPNELGRPADGGAAADAGAAAADGALPVYQTSFRLQYVPDEGRNS